MPEKITTPLIRRTIKNCQEQGRETRLADTELRGLTLRVYPSGRAFWEVRYRTPHGQRVYRIGQLAEKTVTEARKAAAAVLGAVSADRDPVQERLESREAVGKVDRVTAEAVRFAAHAHSKRQPATARFYERMIARFILPAFGHKLMTQVSHDAVEAWHQDIGRQHPVQANRALATLSVIFNHAIKKKGTKHGEPYFELRNPCKGVERFDEDPAGEDLNAGQLAALAEAMNRAETEGLPPSRLDVRQGRRPERLVVSNPVAIAAIRLIMLTGFRKAEVRTLKWSMIDWERREIRLGRTKGKKKHDTRAIGTAVLTVLQAVRDLGVSDEWVFPSPKLPGKPIGSVDHDWFRIREAAGLRSVRLHDLRHAFASTAASQYSLSVVGNLLGHVRQDTTARYTHVDTLAGQAAEDTSNAIFRMMVNGATVTARIIEFPEPKDE